MRKNILINFVIILSVANMFAQSSLSFKSAVEQALLNNYSIRISKVNQQIADKNYSPGKAGMSPKIDFNAGYTYSNNELEMNLATGQIIKKSGNAQNNYNAGIQLSMTIFDGFAMFLNYNKFEELKNKSDIELRITIETTVQNIAGSYIQGLKLQNSLNILKRNLEISRERLQRLQIKKEYGNANEIEILKAKVDYNNDSANYLRTDLNFRNNLKNLNFLMGNSLESVFYLENKFDISINDDLNELRKNAANTNSTLLRALKNREISRLDKRIILAGFLPRLSVNAGYNVTGQNADAGFILKNQVSGVSGTINLNWNLFNGFQDSVNAQNADLTILMNDITTEQLRSQIDLSILNTYDSYLRRQEILNFEEEHFKTAELNYQRTLELYNLGQLSSLELRQAQNNMINAEIRIIEAKFDLVQSKIELSILTGERIF